jgi:cytochrome P450
MTNSRGADESTEFPSDGYARFRAQRHAVTDLGGASFPLFVGYDDVRDAARNWRAFTSDTPFEVPIPPEHGVRPVRQLPIETDPPDHTDYRAITAHFFSRSAADEHAPAVAAVVDAIIDDALGDTLDVIPDLALPVVNHGLAATLGRPKVDAELWLTWGVHVFHSNAGGKSANEELNAYLEGAVDSACTEPGDDFFGILASSNFRGRSLTRDEMLGFGNLVFAGGRDTVAKAIAAACWYLATHRDEWARLRADASLVRPAVEEILRLSSPLPFIGRHAVARCEYAGAQLDTGDLVALGFAAANRDPEIFDGPDECRLDRWPNRHIAFGHGPHTCSGAHLARMEIGTTIERLLSRVEHLELAEPAIHNTLTIAGSDVGSSVENVVVTLCT